MVSIHFGSYPICYFHVYLIHVFFFIKNQALMNYCCNGHSKCNIQFLNFIRNIWCFAEFFLLVSPPRPVLVVSVLGDRHVMQRHHAFMTAFVASKVKTGF